MKLLIKKLLRENLTNYTIVYRGQGNYEHISPNSSIWVTYNNEFAQEYGKITKFKLPNSLSILDTEISYSTWEKIVDEYQQLTDEIGDYDEYKYEPSNNFIKFLSSKGYDGFENGDNILIFNKKDLIKC